MNLDSNTVVITPHAEQAKMLSSKKRFILALAGVQGGKTFGGCLWTQLRIQENPKGVGLITALSHDQLNNVVIDKFLNMFPPYRKFYRKGDKTIELPTGARIFFRSLEDPRYVEGISANWAWIDEADLVGFKGYLIIRGRVNATNGKVLMTSSIADNSWLADYLNKIDPNEMEVISWKSRDNPAFSNEEWESLKKELDPSLFRRRYEADLNFNSGLVYGRFKEKHILKEIPIGETVKKVFIGMDWGYVDPTTVVLIVYTESGKLYVVEEFGSESLDLDIIVAVVQKFIKLSVERWGKNPVIYADPSNKLFLKSVESRIHHMINPNGVINNDIFDGTAKIRNLIWQNRFFILEHNKETLKEMNRYRFKEKNWERKEEPEDKFNHYLDAVRYPIASYPIYSVGYVKKQKEQELPDFWKRRTPKYKREFERIKNESNDFTDY